jgi:hypothetical protein
LGAGEGALDPLTVVAAVEAGWVLAVEAASVVGERQASSAVVVVASSPFVAVAAFWSDQFVELPQSDQPASLVAVAGAVVVLFAPLPPEAA